MTKFVLVRGAIVRDAWRSRLKLSVDEDDVAKVQIGNNELPDLDG